jgi:isopenicillin N synthase-like dioxygenase
MNVQVKEQQKIRLDALPILDLKQFEDLKTQKKFIEKLQKISKEIGFFYLTGHGISQSQIEGMQKITQAFFQLSQSEKDSLGMIHSPHFRGYTRPNSENTRNLPDFREQIDIGVELNVVEASSSEQLPIWAQLQGPNQWPEHWPEFKTTVTAWQQNLRQVSLKLLRALLLSLEQSEHALDYLVTGTPNELLKLIHYPKVNQKDHQGVGPHKDSNILTLLLQDQIGGLQVLSQGHWIDVPYIENAFVVNIGEILELVTNGYLIANQHRVISPEYADRYSIAYFLSPKLFAGQIKILDLPEHLRIQAQGPETDPLNPLLGHVGENCIKGRLRSHLDVTQKYYPEQYEQLIKARLN